MLGPLLDLVLPQACAGCGGHPGPVCGACRRILLGPAREARPVPAPAGLPTVMAACEYADAVRRLLVAHKERGRHQLSAALGAALAGAIGAGLDDPSAVLVVPVPSRAASSRARGYDHARRIAAHAVDRLGGAASLAPVLRLRAAVADQGGLDAAARSRNLGGAMAVRSDLSRAGLVVVVDDVMTTGSTLAEATRALRAAGATQVRGAVVAATRRRWAPRL